MDMLIKGHPNLWRFLSYLSQTGDILGSKTSNTQENEFFSSSYTFGIKGENKEMGKKAGESKVGGISTTGIQES